MPSRPNIVTAVYEHLGGQVTFGRPITSEADLATAVLRKLPMASIQSIRRWLAPSEITSFIIPARTMRHRQSKNEPLSVEESDRAVRLARIQSIAEDVFADIDKAKAWLREPLPALGNEAPLEFARTEIGARVIERILASIDWGAAA